MDQRTIMKLTLEVCGSLLKMRQTQTNVQLFTALKLVNVGTPHLRAVGLCGYVREFAKFNGADNTDLSEVINFLKEISRQYVVEFDNHGKASAAYPVTTPGNYANELYWLTPDFRSMWIQGDYAEARWHYVEWVHNKLKRNRVVRSKKMPTFGDFLASKRALLSK